MFERVAMAPPDSILGVTEAFNKDPNPAKINLSIGVYKDAAGKTPIFAAVKAAEKRLLETENTKNYAPIEGRPEYGAAVRELLLGPGHPMLRNGQAVTAHTPGGTGALRVAGDFIRKVFGATTIWLSDPTWPNHPQVFEAAGLKVKTYPYFDARTNSLAFEPMMAALGQIPAGEVVLLHGCCHNPTGIDPTAQQWEKIVSVVRERGLLPLLDFAYQGLAAGLREDAVGFSALADSDGDLLVASSFSKNFGLYNDRVGALTVIAREPQSVQAALSQIKASIRSNYSNPAAHGGAIVTTILADPELRKQWEAEVTTMRQRINGMRKAFVETLQAKGVKTDFSFIMRQTGMFSFSGLKKEQVETLRAQHAIYIVGSGRINVAGMTAANMDRLSAAIASVM